MTTINNHDTSSTGVSIICTLQHDDDQARYDFEQNFKLIQCAGKGKGSVSYYINNGNVEDDDQHVYVIEGEEKELIQFMQENCDLVNIKGMDIDQLKEEIREFINMEYTLSVEQLKPINENYFHSFDIRITTLKPVKSIDIQGYNQGDYGTVYYCPTDLVEAWGCDTIDEDALKKEFEQTFYDSPIYAHIEINGESFEYHEYCDDSYIWEREKYLKAVAQDSNASYDQLNELMPEDASPC